jgi:superfamily I DNA/RNA helicase
MKLLMTTIPGLGEKTAEQIEAVWRQQTQISAEHLRALPTQRIWSERVRLGFDDLLQTMEQTTEHIQSDITRALIRLKHSPIWSPLQTRYPSAEHSLEKLIRCTKLEMDMTVYLDQVLLSREYDGFGEEVERVSLMTMHAAKGLEFPVVFIVGCEHELIPLQYPGMESDVDEERRLFYVGMTRAKEQLYCVQAKRRMLFGNTYQTYPSPFLADIEEQLKHYEQTEQRKRSKEKSKPIPTTQLNLFGE